MKQASFQRHTLHFKQPSGTSRGVLNTKQSWFIKVLEYGKIGIGECSVIKGLSIDDRPDFENKLSFVCDNINSDIDILNKELVEFPSIQFGLEMALKSLESINTFELFPSDFTTCESPIHINGLIWMGDKKFMLEQIKNKLESGFKCLKLKIGALDFQTEIEIIKSIRKDFNYKEVELRVDANGAFDSKDALEKLKILSDLNLHSIEQPIKAGNVNEMAKLCELTPLPIALDEELIGIVGVTNKAKLLQTIKPQFIILKPSLIGGFKSSQEWINEANKNKICWWITSALESNIGLSAISQWTYLLHNKLPQGLGTGGLYTNNIDSPLVVDKGALYYKKALHWNFNI